MTAQETETFTLNLMDQWGLTDRHWKFGWNNRKSALGLCRMRDRIIELSTYFWPAISEEQQKDTIRHEIAHALDFEQRGYSDHGPKWKLLAMRVGAKPVACVTLNIEEKDVQPSKYILICPNGHRFPSHRLQKRRSSCPSCSTSRYFDARFVLAQQPNG